LVILTVVGSGAWGSVILVPEDGEPIEIPLPFDLELPASPTPDPDPDDDDLIFVSPITTTVPLTLTLEPIIAPTATITVTDVPSKPGIYGLAFHPSHLNAGGKCAETYTVQGSLKNHGPVPATGVEVAYEVTSGSEWVDAVEVSMVEFDELDGSKPARYAVSVTVNEEWANAGKGEEIEVLITATSAEGWTAEATVVVRNQCTDKPDKPAKPEKPEKPEKPTKPDKPVKPEKPNKNK